MLTPLLRLDQVSDLIWCVRSPDKAAIAHTFIRFQEFYENPVFKDKNGFTSIEVEDWWRTINQEDSYSEFWTGFNVPGYIFLDVIKSPSFFPFSLLEIEMMELLKNISSFDLCQGVVIGVGDNVQNVFDHEYAHALYHTNIDYREEQIENLNELTPVARKFMTDEMLVMGYDQSVIDDEIHAYLSTYVHTLEPGVWTMNSPPFVRTFNKYCTHM